MMMGLPAGTRVWLAVSRTDMRKGFDGLAAAVQERMAQDPFCGHLFVFRGRRGDLIKVLWWDGQGLCLFAKRLEKGRFVWPSPADGNVVITPAQLGMLLEGIDWRNCGHCPRWLEFLRENTNGDEQLIGFLRRMSGYCLSGSTSEHALFFCYATSQPGR